MENLNDSPITAHAEQSSINERNVANLYDEIDVMDDCDSEILNAHGSQKNKQFTPQNFPVNINVNLMKVKEENDCKFYLAPEVLNSTDLSFYETSCEPCTALNPSLNTDLPLEVMETERFELNSDICPVPLKASEEINNFSANIAVDDKNENADVVENVEMSLLASLPVVPSLMVSSSSTFSASTSSSSNVSLNLNTEEIAKERHSPKSSENVNSGLGADTLGISTALKLANVNKKIELLQGQLNKALEEKRTLEIQISSASGSPKENSKNEEDADEKPFHCSYGNCSFSTKRARYLKVHAQIHSDEKTLSCVESNCRYKCKSMMALRKHRATHSGMRKVKCKICASTFAFKYDLEVHYRKHTNEKPYKCPLCVYAAKQKAHLKEHVKRKHSKGIPSSSKSGLSCFVNTCKVVLTNGKDMALHLRLEHNLPRILIEKL